MKTTGKCPKCGSTEIVADAKAIDHGHGNHQGDMMLATFRKPEALLFKGSRKTTLSAWMCMDCGFVELYADSPENLKLPGSA
ncbi:MAG: hypothetical protein JWM59_123 [Verrucomicrobiales bacterium]|nr:hypothetical protein [Verrucomicrobiales bacterium]